MKMGKLEKLFINTEKHYQQTINRAERLFSLMDVKGKQRFLEVGCGCGALSKHVAGKYQWDVTGLDVDPEQIKVAESDTEGIANLRFLVDDATSLPFPDRDLDIILSFGVLHHIPGLWDVLKEIKRVIRPGGYFFYSDILFPGMAARIAKVIGSNYGINTIPELAEFMKDNDFSEVHTSVKNLLAWYEYEAVYRNA